MSSEAKHKVILLIDMDCFYVQVERRKNPELCGKPCIVVQGTGFNPEGATIAVSYEARKFGVSRSTRENEAKSKCPDLQIVYVPERRGKADLTCYRQAGAEFIQILSEFTDIIERASIDEAYLDVTELVAKRIEMCGLENSITPESVPNTQVTGFKGESSGESCLAGWLREEGSKSELLLAAGAMVANDIRREVFERTGFTCSAGIGQNKMVAKLCAGMNKPNGQTILPPSVLPAVFMTTPIGKIRHLGGKLGAQLKRVFGIEHIGELTSVSLSELEGAFGAKTSAWLYRLCRGEDSEPVRVRTLPQSVGCGKDFPKKHRLTTAKQVKHWLQQLAEEVSERLAVDQREHNRRATLMSVGFLPVEMRSGFLTRCFPIENLHPDFIVQRAWAAITKGHSKAGSDDSPLTWTGGLVHLYLSASKFSGGPANSSTPTIHSFFASTSSQDSPVTVSTPEHSVTDTRSRSTNSHARQPKQNIALITQYFSPVKETDQQAKSDDITDSTTPPAKKRKLEVSDFVAQDSSPLTSVSTEPDDLVFHALLDSEGDCVPPTCVGLSEGPLELRKSTSELLPNDLDSYENLAPELLTVCGVCGCRVAVWAEQEHADYHLALQLQQEDRDQGDRVKNEKRSRGSSILDFVVR